MQTDSRHKFDRSRPTLQEDMCKVKEVMFVGTLFSCVANEGCILGYKPSVNRPYVCLLIRWEVVQRIYGRQSFPTVLYCLFMLQLLQDKLKYFALWQFHCFFCNLMYSSACDHQSCIGFVTVACKLLSRDCCNYLGLGQMEEIVRNNRL